MASSRSSEPVYPADAHRGACVAGLDKDRKIQSGFDFVPDGIGGGIKPVCIEPQVMGLLNICRGEQGMGNRFIHTYGGRECVAAYIGNTRKLEQPLYGAVFAIFAVQSWEDCVKPEHWAPSWCRTRSPWTELSGDRKAGTFLFVFLPTSVSEGRGSPL